MCLLLLLLVFDLSLQTVRYCSEVPADQVIPEHAHDSEGEVDVQDIFCAKCKGTDSTDDNDLVLCDGPCNRYACKSCQMGTVSLPANQCSCRKGREVDIDG